MLYRELRADEYNVAAKLRFDFVMSFADNKEQLGGFLEANAAYIAEATPKGELVTLVAEDENSGEIAGIVMMSVYRALPVAHNIGGKNAYIYNVWTLPPYRGKGICHTLMEMLLERAKAMGIGCVQLSATEMGYHVYSSLGFTVCEREMKKYL